MKRTMDLERVIMLHSGASFPELYKVLSEGIRNAEVKSGVLLFMYTPNYLSYPCDDCYLERHECVHAAGSCVMHDAGDAIVVEWIEENVQLSDAISQAVQRAFNLLDLCRVQRRRHNSRRIIKIAIAAGRFSRVRVGHRGRRVCVVFGPAVEEIWSAVLLAGHCDIVLSPEAWRLCNRQNLIFEPVGSEGAVKVHHNSQQQRVPEEILRPHNTDTWMSPYSRMAFLLTNAERENAICKFMTQTAVDQIHKKCHLRNPSETWPTSIIFMNLLFAHTVLSDSHREVSNIVAEQMFRCCGEICSFFFFEEGCVFVCAVGLPGDKRQDMAASALQAANSIYDTCLREISNLWRISVSVTTGRVFYTFEEMPLGKRYTVYGDPVILAAKLMMDNLRSVSYDMATKLYSMLPFPRVMPQAIFSPHESVCYCDEINEMLVNEAAVSPRELDGRRMALAHMQTMSEDEQQVVTNASVIGQTFSIDMLKEILPNMREEQIIKTLRSLVRAGIIKCASISGDNSSTKTCDCNKISKEYTKVSMDPVWPCRLMSFCNSDEMKAVYKLVQRNESLLEIIHKICAYYLEDKTYRCSKCKNKTFMFEHKAATELLVEIYKTIRPYEVFQRRGISRRKKIYPDEGNGNETVNSLTKVKTELTEGHDRMTAGSCECAQLVETELFPRTKHWRCAGDMHMTFYYLLESAAACVYLQNDARALDYLTEARSIVENGHLPEFPSEHYERVGICEQQAFMHRLTGEILLRTGNIMEAEESIRKALKLLNCKLPRNNCAQSLKLIREKMKNLLYRSRQFEIPEKTKLGCLQERIDCLSLLWQISVMCGQHKTASLAITMQINLAIRSTDPYKILYSGIDYLKYSHFKGEESKCRHLKAFLCRTCPRLSDHPEGQLLNDHLTRALALVEMCPADLEQF